MVVANNKLTATKNADESVAISMAMAMERYDARRIARWSTSRASLEATGCRHCPKRVGGFGYSTDFLMRGRYEAI